MNMGGMNSYGEQNVFIASLPRSGSTLLGMILNQHNQCFNIGESFYWAKINPEHTICSCGKQACSVLKNVYQIIKDDNNILKISQTIFDIDSILQNDNRIQRDQIAQRFHRDIADSCTGFDNLADIFRKEIRKNIIIDTSSNIILALNLVKLKKWKIIILVRDPRGVISSLKMAATRHGREIPRDLWCNYVVDFINRVDDMRNMKNVIILRYEDLCTSSNVVLDKLCKFLNISYDPKILQFRQDKGHILMANRMRFGVNEDIIEDSSWKTNLSKEEINVISSNIELAIAYRKHNYDI